MICVPFVSAVSVLEEAAMPPPIACNRRLSKSAPQKIHRYPFGVNVGDRSGARANKMPRMIYKAAEKKAGAKIVQEICMENSAGEQTYSFAAALAIQPRVSKAAPRTTDRYHSRLRMV